MNTVSATSINEVINGTDASIMGPKSKTKLVVSFKKKWWYNET